MPIYEFQCLDCRNAFEKLFFRGDRELVACPECGSENTKQRPNSGSFMTSKGVGACASNAPKGFS